MSRGGAEVESTSQSLITVDIDRVVGFEAVTASDWSIIQSGPGTLSSSTTASQGSRSLSVSSHGYVPVQSVAMSSLDSRVGSVIHYDIMIPPEVKQANPGWCGATQLYMDIPSIDLNSGYIGQVDLTPLPVGQWNTLSFTPSASILAKLRASYTDLRVTIVVNAPYNATKPYLLDNLRFSDKTLAVVNLLDGSGNPIVGDMVVAYNGATPTSNTGVTDSSGVARIWLPPGSYRFGTTDAGITSYSSASNQCQVPGVCLAATIIARCHAVVCLAMDTCHNVGACDPGTGTCSNPAKPAGTVCRPSSGLCDIAEICDGTDADCPADRYLQASLVCRPSIGACDVVEICSGTSAACPADGKAANDSPCDDSNACTKQDKCQNGTCVGGTPVVCMAADQCHVAGTCDPGTGECTVVSKPDGVNCSYGTGCPDEESCQIGSCMSGSCAHCAGINLVATKSYNPGASTDAEQTFNSASLFAVPNLLKVIDGLSGTGTAVLSIRKPDACETCFVTCLYRGGSAQEHPSTPRERALAAFYILESCDSGLSANQKLLVTALRLHVEQGDSQAGTTSVQHLVSCAEDQSAVAQPFPEGSDKLLPTGWSRFPTSPGDPQPSPPQPPSPNLPGSNPEVNGVFIPTEDSSIVFIER